MSQVITVNGFNRRGNIESINLLKVPKNNLLTQQRAQVLRRNQLRDALSSGVPANLGGLTPAELRQEALRSVTKVPPIAPVDYDLPLDTREGGSGGAFLIGGNDLSQITRVEQGSYIDLGIRGQDASDLGLDIITDGMDRIRINGNQDDTISNAIVEEEAANTLSGRVVIANGMIEQGQIPSFSASFFITEGTGTGRPFLDLYMRYPSNAYVFILSNEEFTLPPTPTFATDFPGYAAVVIGNMYIGGTVDGYPFDEVDPAYIPSDVIPAGFDLGIDTFNFLYKFINRSGSPVAIFFNQAAPQYQITTIRPTLNTAPYLVPAGGAIFFEFRVDRSTGTPNPAQFTMLHNTIYSEYNEAIPGLQ